MIDSHPRDTQIVIRDTLQTFPSENEKDVSNKFSLPFSSMVSFTHDLFPIQHEYSTTYFALDGFDGLS